MANYILLILSLLLFTNCDPMKDFKILYAEEALDESMKMEVYYREAMSFGPQDIKVFVIEPEGEKYLVIEDKVYNDGSNLYEKNVGVKWLINAQAEISIRGKEMDTKKYLLTKESGKYQAILQ